MEEKTALSKSTRISMHSLKNILGSQEQTSLFSEHDKKFADAFGIELFNSIDRFGVELSDIQLTMMEGLLKGFNETGYKGNIDPTATEDLLNGRYSGQHPEAYKYIKEIPRLKATQSQILCWAGINKNSIAAKTRALEALLNLGTTQFCFYYDRLFFSETGQPEKDKNGNWKKEQISTVDTLFTIKSVRDENDDSLCYYEITPSSIFLDQIDGYFVLIPYKWREEVRKIFGNKKASAYTFRFLLFLRYKYEQMRRIKNSSTQQCQIKWSPEEIAIAIKMPESVYIKKKKRMNEILADAYSVAKQLGYLSDFDRQGYKDILTLNDQKYSLQPTITKTDSYPQDIETENHKFSNELLEIFISSRRSIDNNYKLSCESRYHHLKPFLSLLEQQNRTKDEIVKIIHWSQTQNFWVTRMSTPEKFEKAFTEAFMAYKTSRKISVEERYENNKNLSFEKFQHLSNKLECIDHYKHPKLTILNKGVEFLYAQQCTVVEYADPHFHAKIREGLAKYRFEEVEFPTI